MKDGHGDRINKKLQLAQVKVKELRTYSSDTYRIGILRLHFCH